MPFTVFDFTSGKLDLRFLEQDRNLKLDAFGLAGSSWLNESIPSRLFSVQIGERTDDASTLAFEKASIKATESGVRHVVLSFSGPGFEIDQHLKVYDGSSLIELWPVIRCTGETPCHITRVDSFSLAISPAAYELFHFTGDWGQEFEPVRTGLSGSLVIQSRSGRSSKGEQPWFSLQKLDGSLLTGSVAWSANWIVRFKPLADGGYCLCGGLNNWGFSRDLLPGEEMIAPAVVLALGNSLNDTAQQFTRVGRAYWYPRNQLSASLPVEWNHWWPYQDTAIDEETFKKNVIEAAHLGVELCTLDAGWFGPSDAESKWYEHRGDWGLVNERRFPGGIRHLSEFTHTHGMRFGLWCEIEGLGVKAQLARDHPEFVATLNGETLGYVCFGNPDAQEWAFQTLCRLIRGSQCDWIKLDFNLDPGSGCNRFDHGHGSGDGLYEHIMGYYLVLDRVRAAFPEVVLENCSSGGLRIDLGMLRHTHLTFLSDPDWPVHDLQIFWGASQMIAPETCLHWSFCEWTQDDHPPQQTFNPRDPELTQRQLDYYTRISMLGVFGFSQKLPDLPAWVAERLTVLTAIYKKHIRRFVSQGDLFHLTGQPRRNGAGDRWTAFQYSLPDRSEHLLAVFRLLGAPQEWFIPLAVLDPARVYTIEGFEGEHKQQMTGETLTNPGLRFGDLAEGESTILRIY